MTNKEAADILDPDTSREALRPYIYDPPRRLEVMEEACRVAAKVLRFVSNTGPLTIDSSGWTDEELESIKKMLNECSATVQIPANILSGDFVGSNKMEPLTLEQLREMDGQPVWGKSLINDKPGEWFIIRIVEMSKTWFIACAGAEQGFGDKDNYGEVWLAYAYPPAHIDLEAGGDINVFTNADRIRAMSDEELAKFLCDFRSCDSSAHPCDGCKAEPHCHTGHSGMIDWLSQPAEEE